MFLRVGIKKELSNKFMHLSGHKMSPTSICLYNLYKTPVPVHVQYCTVFKGVLLSFYNYFIIYGKHFHFRGLLHVVCVLVAIKSNLTKPFFGDYL